MQDNFEVVVAALDSDDERDYDYDELAWSSEQVALPRKVLLDTGHVQNQFKAWYRMGCVYFSAWEGSNWSTKERLQGGELCDESLTWDSEIWDYVRNWTLLLKSRWTIKWFSKAKTLNSVKKALADQRVILTWSNKINRNLTKKNNIASWVSWSWHAFHLIWYDDDQEWLIAKNSSWKENYDNWLFYIKYEDFEKYLFNTKDVLIEDEDTIIAYKKKIMSEISIWRAEKAVGKLWNWERPKDGVTREEAAAMSQSAYEQGYKDAIAYIEKKYWDKLK